MRGFALGLVILLSGINGTCFAQSATAVLSADEAQFARMINQFRQSLGLPRLDIQPALQSAARKHSDWMAGQDFLTHIGPYTNFTPFQRMQQEGYTQYYFAGENIACGNADAAKTFRQWAFSPGHLLNMLNPHFHEMGIAKAGTGNERCPYYWTNDFGTYQNPAQDSAGTSDVAAINQAVAQVSGAIPSGTSVSLNENDPAQTVPIVGQSSTPTDPVSPTPTPAPDTVWQRLYAMIATGGSTVSPQASPVASLQCLVPYAIGKGILTYYTNTDTLIEATPQMFGGYAIKLSYFQNANPTSLFTVNLSNVTITQNADFPILTLFSVPGSRVGGFSVQVNTRTNQAQFDSYGISPGVTGTIQCIVRSAASN